MGDQYTDGFGPTIRVHYTKVENGWIVMVGDGAPASRATTYVAKTLSEAHMKVTAHCVARALDDPK